MCNEFQQLAGQYFGRELCRLAHANIQSRLVLVNPVTTCLTIKRPGLARRRVNDCFALHVILLSFISVFDLEAAASSL